MNNNLFGHFVGLNGFAQVRGCPDLTDFTVYLHLNWYSFPYITAMIKQLMSDVYWQDTDYLIIDTPPGTSDEHITTVEAIRDYAPDGAILVTTPQV